MAKETITTNGQPAISIVGVSSAHRICSQSVGNSGFYKVEDKPMSDNLSYRNQRYNDYAQGTMDRCLLGIRANKIEQVEIWLDRIAKYTARLEEIKADKSLAETEKQHKIQKYIAAITSDKASIADAERYMGIHVTNNAHTH